MLTSVPAYFTFSSARVTLFRHIDLRALPPNALNFPLLIFELTLNSTAFTAPTVIDSIPVLKNALLLISVRESGSAVIFRPVHP